MTETTFTIEQITFKVQALLAKAADPACTPQEADLFREKANAMMIKYRVEAATAAEAPGAAIMEPEWSRAYLGPLGSQWSNYVYSFATMAARATGIRISVHSEKVDDHWAYVAEVCGFAHDVAFFNLVFTNVVEAFTERLDPKVEPHRTEADNAYRLRRGGMERGRIARALGMPLPTTENVMKAQNRRVTKLIKEGAPTPADSDLVLGRSFNAQTYRRSYAQGFYNEMHYRLMTLQLAEGEGGLILKRAKDAVDEAWYVKYPDARPKPVTKDTDHFAALRPCDKCKKAKSGHCRDHRPLTGRGRPVNYDAIMAGRSAARTVDVGAVRSNRLN